MEHDKQQMEVRRVLLTENCKLCPFPDYVKPLMRFPQRASLMTQMVRTLLERRRPRFDCWVKKVTQRRKQQPTPVFLPGEFCGQEPGGLHGVADLEGKGEKERYTHWMQSSKELQGEIRKPSSVISAKKQRKTTDRERLEIPSRKLELLREHLTQR